MVAETSFSKQVKLVQNEISKRNLKISEPTAGENIFSEILSLRQDFSNLICPPQAKKNSGKYCRWNEFWLEFNFSSKNENKKNNTPHLAHYQKNALFGGMFFLIVFFNY